uniref:Vitelline membrane outer layer 1 homolog n=1 Tax=Anser brachyrhynchus TaxID=132585 RepID=A0A8B9CC90_9AVES
TSWLTAMPGAWVLLLLVGLAGTTGRWQGQDLGRSDASVISVSNGGPWGDWAWPEMCPKGSYASGVSFKVQPLCWARTLLLRLQPWPGTDCCFSPSRWGSWTEVLWCPHQGHLVGFALQVQVPQHGFLHDEVAATNARFACSDGQVLQGPGSVWGQWGGWSHQCPKAVCGIQTRQEPAWGLKRDDTALNDLRLFCCQ